MQTTAIRTVANSLPENEVILLTLLISKRYIPLYRFTEILWNMPMKVRFYFSPVGENVFSNWGQAGVWPVSLGRKKTLLWGGQSIASFGSKHCFF